MSAVEMRDAVVKEQLLAALYTPKKKPKTSEEAGQLVDDYLQAHSTQVKSYSQPQKQPQKLIKCFSCNQKDYNCPQTSPLYFDTPGDGLSGHTKEKIYSTIKQLHQ